jgi:thioredoxin reductase
MVSVQPHPPRNVLDVLVIGAGPAGLSASLTLGRVLRSAVVFDSREYRNAASTHAHAIPMHDGQDPTELRRKMKNELQHKYKTITFANSSARIVRESNGIFEVVDGNAYSWKGRKVILASGRYDILPDIPGYRESWGKGMRVYYVSVLLLD